MGRREANLLGIKRLADAPSLHGRSADLTACRLGAANRAVLAHRDDSGYHHCPVGTARVSTGARDRWWRSRVLGDRIATRLRGFCGDLARGADGHWLFADSDRDWRGAPCLYGLPCCRILSAALDIRHHD